MDYDEYVKQPLPFMKSLRRYFRKRDKLVIFEIGSCEGEDTIRLKRAFPRSTIFTFEALPKNVQKIKRNLVRYNLSTQHLFQVALSDKNGTADFYVSSGHPDELPKSSKWDYGNKSSSLLAPKEHKKILRWVKFKEKINVKTQRLDSFCGRHGIDRIDFIYLDVQGAELMVLEGSGDLIKNIGAVWMEVEAVELYEGQPLKSDVEKFMNKNGFNRIVDTVDDVSGDQLYLHQGLRPHKTVLAGLNQFLDNRQ